MGDFHFWIPLPDGAKQIASIPEDYVKNVMLKHVEHEPGHAVAAHHSGAMLIGIAVGFLPARHGMFLYTAFGWGSEERPDFHTPTIEEQCVIKAAGPAAELMLRGSYDEKGASEDLNDIGRLTDNLTPSFAPYMPRATSLLRAHEEEIRKITSFLENRIKQLTGMSSDTGVATDYPTLVRLPDGHMGYWLLSAADLMPLLNPWQDPSRPRCIFAKCSDHSNKLVTLFDAENRHEIEICLACLPFAKEGEWFRWYSLRQSTTG